jgi:hypothetical protein
MSSSSGMSLEEEQDCFGCHDYEYQESLSSGPDGYQELFVCIHCGHNRILSHHIGIRD